MRLSLLVLIALVAHGGAALRVVTPGSTNIGRRSAVLAAVPALFAATTSPAFASTVGAAPTPEGEAKFDEVSSELRNPAIACARRLTPLLCDRRS